MHTFLIVCDITVFLTLAGSGMILKCKAVVITTGTFLKGRIFIGEVNH